MPNLEEYDVYYLGRQIFDIFDSRCIEYNTTKDEWYYLEVWFINDDGQIEKVGGNSTSFKFVKKEKVYERLENIY